MEEEKINSKKKTMLICSITVVAVILIVGISYAFWQLTKLQEDTNIISSGCFGVNLEGNEAINLTSAYPLKTEEGMKSTPYTFTITNTCSGSANYIVNLESLSNTTFQNTSIRVALDNTDKLYSEYEESNKYFEDSIEARTLISGTLQDGESVTYNLRMWIDESAPSSEQNKIFASKIVVTSGQDGVGIDPEITDLEATSTIDTINITYNANGDISTTCKYGIEVGTYDNDVADATASNCNITGLSENTTYYYQVCTETGKGSKCVDGELATKANTIPFTQEDVGKYVSMTPTATSYSIATSLTGYSSAQTINPSELNLWRIIKVNTDGTIEMVSDKVSSTEITFYGKNGYMNLVGGLNTIAAQYTDGKHVLRTRHIGYSNQIEKCSGPLLYQNPGDCDGDTGYETDIQLVNMAYTGTAVCTSPCTGLVANNPSGAATFYWYASRYRGYNGESWYYGGRFAGTGGGLGTGSRMYSVYSGGTVQQESDQRAVRPIVVLKSTSEKLSGSGTSSSPYQLN